MRKKPWMIIQRVASAVAPAPALPVVSMQMRARCKSLCAAKPEQVCGSRDATVEGCADARDAR